MATVQASSPLGLSPLTPHRAGAVGSRVGGALLAVLSAVVAGRATLEAVDPAGTAPRYRVR